MSNQGSIKHAGDQESVDVSVILTAHSEGNLIFRTLQAIFAAIDTMNSAGLTGEVVVVCDLTNDDTMHYLHRFSDRLRLIKNDEGDLGLSRNKGIRAAKGKYISVMDGDDLFSSRFLLDAYKLAERCVEKTVFVPEFYIGFEQDYYIGRHIGTDHPAFSKTRLLQDNFWGPHIFIRRSAFDTYAYYPTNFKKRLGYEDWHLYCQLLADDYKVLTIPESVIFYRKKRGMSLLKETQLNQCVVSFSHLFDPPVFSRLTFPKNTERAKQPDTYPTPEDYFLEDVDYARCTLVPWKVQKQWREIHGIEPSIFPYDWLKRYDTSAIPIAPITYAYHAICQQIASLTQADYLFFVPWLIRGGADLVSLNYIEAVRHLCPKASIMVVATEAEESVWKARLPKDIPFLEFGTLTKDLDDVDKQKLLIRLCIQLKPSVVHIINSNLAYDTLTKYQTLLVSLTRIYISCFCFDRGPFLEKGGYPLKLPEIFDSLTAMFSDNHQFTEELWEQYGLDRSKMYTHYQPIQIQPKFVVNNSKSSFSKNNPLQVLWTGRFDRQKRIELLLDLAEATINLPVHYNVYGAPSIAPSPGWERVNQLQNVSYHGPYDDFYELNINDIDVYLYTSSYDGMPNVLLEAVSRGLPIIAPKEGGVPELIRHLETGILIQEHNNPDEYKQALEQILASEINLETIRENALQLIKDQHSTKRFHEQLKGAPGYLLHP